MSFNFIKEPKINGYGQSVFTFFEKGFRLNGKARPAYIDVILSGVSPLVLTNAIELNYLKLFGGTELLPETYLDTVTLSGGTEQRNLPNGHQQLNYLQGDGTAYIETDVVPTNNTGMKIVFEYGELGGSAATSGVFDGVIPRQDTFFVSTNSGSVSSNTTIFIAHRGDTLSSTGSEVEVPVVGKTYTALINYMNDGYIGFEGFTQKQLTTLSDVLPNKVLLFARLNYNNDNITASLCKIKYVEFTEGAEVIRKYYPDRYNNTLGLYDTITNTFLTNKNSSGAFTAGSAITTPSPTTPIDIVCNNGVVKAQHESGLPLGYTQVESITFDGSSYINTGIKANSAYTYKFKVKRTSPYNSNIWGVKTNSGYSADSCIILGWTGTTDIGIYSHEGSDTGGNAQVLPWGTNYHTIEFNPTSKKLIIDGVDRWSALECGCLTNENWSSDIYNLYLGGTNTVGSFVGGGVSTWAQYEVWNGGVLRQKLISCKNSSNVIGMYDTVSGTFLTNAGSGTFTAGSTVSDPVEIYVEGTQEVVTDSLGNTANAERLLAVGNYKDTQSVINGQVTRNIGIKVLDGTEDWRLSTNQMRFYLGLTDCKTSNVDVHISSLCSHLTDSNQPPAEMTTGYGIWTTSSAPYIQVSINNFTFSTVADFKTFLANQYAQGTPVIVVYPLATATTESVSGQFLSKSPVTQTAGSIDNLPIAITESSHTVPTPQQPLPINCNNGVVKVDSQGNIYTDGTVETVGITGKNLFNSVTAVQNKYINSIGQEIESTGTLNSLCHTDFIPVIEGEDYTISGVKASGYYNTGAFNWFPSKNLTTILSTRQTYATTSSATTYNASATAPAGAKYLIVNYIIGTDQQLELGSTATTYEPYYNGGTATAENLFKLDTYQDVQSVIDGVVTRNVGIKVLDGTEDWSQVSGSSAPFALVVDDFTSLNLSSKVIVYSTHFQGVSASATWSNYENLISFTATTTSYDTRTFRVRYLSNTKTLAEFKQFLADQYANGTPVICVYYKTATTETVTGQPLTVQQGTNTVTITQASINNLTMEVSYKSGVRVTVTEIENAQLSNNVEVTIS